MITVFTPTYNRAYLLPRLYESLCKQTSQDFLWMVIDDGSTDNTKQLVKQWQNENEIEIQYFYKENGGMHTGHNLAYSKMTTELNVCIDSDDYMPDNAVEDILKCWQGIEDKNNLAGIIALDADMNGKIIGTEMPKNVERGTFIELYHKYHATNDKKVILKTKVVNEFPTYPEYKNEKLVPLGSLYNLISMRYQFIYLNKVVCNVDYQIDGSVNTIFKQYFISPRGFAYDRKVQLKTVSGFKNKVKNCIHLVSNGITVKSFSLVFKNNPNKVLTVLLLPFGILFNIYFSLRYK